MSCLYAFGNERFQSAEVIGQACAGCDHHQLVGIGIVEQLKGEPGQGMQRGQSTNGSQCQGKGKLVPELPVFDADIG